MPAFKTGALPIRPTLRRDTGPRSWPANGERGTDRDRTCDSRRSYRFPGGCLTTRPPFHHAAGQPAERGGLEPPGAASPCLLSRQVPCQFGQRSIGTTGQQRGDRDSNPGRCDPQPLSRRLRLASPAPPREPDGRTWDGRDSNPLSPWAPVLQTDVPLQRHRRPRTMVSEADRI